MWYPSCQTYSPPLFVQPPKASKTKETLQLNLNLVLTGDNFWFYYKFQSNLIMQRPDVYR